MRSGSGIFSIGNIKPLSIIVGRNIPVNAMNMAVCCESVLVEMSKPKAKQVSVNKILSKMSSNKLPLTGTSSTNTLSNRILEIFTILNNKYGTALATTILKGCMGDTSITSIVPNSFSLTMVMAVINVHTSISTMAITPGTKL